jgi:hypothetical protein
MNTTIISIVAAECKRAAEGKETLEERIDAVFEVARNHWLTTDENERFQGGVAAIYELSDEDTRERIKQEMDSLRTLSAMLSGVPVDVERFNEETKEMKPIGLMKKWKP